MQFRLSGTLPSSTIAFLLTAISFLTIIPACNNGESPDEIRQRTAQATETMRRDTKAVVEGVKEGMGHDGAVNINKASREQLLTLPDLTGREADRIIADRPFNNTDDLVQRRILTQAEYDRIRNRVIAAR
jgi:DNA uptake protein ComE-like DNA-binding protein